MNRLFLMSFGFVGFSLFAPPKIVQNPPFFTPTAEMKNTDEYKKRAKKVENAAVTFFPYNGTLYIMNNEEKVRLATKYENDVFNGNY